MDKFTGQPFNYDATPIGPLGIKAIVHKKTSMRNVLDFRGKDGWRIGVALDHYRCQCVIGQDANADVVNDTVEFRHHHVTQPSVTPMTGFCMEQNN